jgi:hypothetical protein
MLTTWVIIYQRKTGHLYGWFCRAKSIAEVEQAFWHEMEEH